MKRCAVCFMTVLTAIILLCFSGCSDKTEKFDDLEGLAKAAALSYRTMAMYGSLDPSTPDFAWQTIGWYAAYKGRLNGLGGASITENQLKAIKQILLPDDISLVPPDTVAVQRLEGNGEVVWTFPDIDAFYDDYIDGCDVFSEKQSDLSFAVTLRTLLRFDVVEETVFNIEYVKEKGRYRLSELERSNFVDLDFTWELLSEANNLFQLLYQYGSVKIQEDYASGYGDCTYFLNVDDEILAWSSNSLMGNYKNFLFHADPEEDMVWVLPADRSDLITGSTISDWFIPDDGAMIRLNCTESESIFFSTFGELNTVFTVDRGTLALKRIETFDADDVSLYTFTFRYGEDLQPPADVSAWQGSLRRITLTELSEEEPYSESWLLPENWALDVEEYCYYGECFLDEECTIPYEYPGNGLEYTVWIKPFEE